MGLQAPLLSDRDLLRDRKSLDGALEELEPARSVLPGLVVVLIEELEPELAPELEQLGRLCPEQRLLSGAGMDLLELPPSLAEDFEAQGLRSLGLSAAQDERKSEGPGRGFDLWLGWAFSKGRSGLPYVDAGRLTALLPELLEQVEGSLLLLRLQDAGLPWIPRSGFADEGLLETHTLPAGARRPISPGFDEAWLEHQSGGGLPASTLASWEEARRSELRFLDASLAPLLSETEAPVVMLGQAEPGAPIWLAGPASWQPPEQAEGLSQALLLLTLPSEG